MPSGYAVAIVIGFYPFLISWLWARANQGARTRIPYWEKELGKIGALFDLFYPTVVVGVPDKTAASLEESFDLARKAPNPLNIERLRRADKPTNPDAISAIEEMTAALQSSAGAPAEIAAGIAGRRIRIHTRVARSWIAGWTIFVAIATLALGLYPLLHGGETLLARWIRVPREVARESGQILLVGGGITVLSGILAFLYAPFAWRVVRDTYRKSLEELVPRLPRAR